MHAHKIHCLGCNSSISHLCTVKLPVCNFTVYL